MDKNIHLWLIRIYAVIIILVMLLGILEDSALNIVIAIASVGIIMQSFFVRQKAKEITSKNDQLKV